MSKFYCPVPCRMIQILPLGGGQDVGRSCIVVSIGGRNVMFDCGMHMGFNDERRFPDFTAISASKDFDRVIDLVIISHFHLDHCGGLPYFTEMCGYNGPILMTYPTKDICPILLEDFRKITVERRGEQNFFTSAMIQSCMNKVTAVDLSQEILVGEDIRVKAYYAGHVLGAAMFHVQVGEESVLYTGDYNMTPDRHLGGAVIDRCKPDVLITESTYAATVRDSKRARERDFLKQVHQCVASGGKVLVPTFALGRVQELCILIDAYWTRAGLSDIPVYFTGGMAGMATKYYKNWMEWTNESIQMTSLKEKSPETGNPSNPFDFKNIKPFEKSFSDLPGPMLVFSTPGMLHSGTSLELFKKWCSDPLNMLIIPGYCVAGTVGAKVLAGQRSIEVQEVRVRGTNMTSTTVTLPVNLQVKNLSFSAHVDAKGILQLISQCRPKNVVLVHGEASKMANLSNRIVETFRCPVYYPANGQVLFIETLPGAAESIEISRNLLEKCRKDVHEAAIEVFKSQSLKRADKVKMLCESAILQDTLNLVNDSQDCCVLVNSPVDSKPLLQSPWECPDQIHSLPHLTALKHFVKRFFKKDKLKSPNGDYISSLHNFLLKKLHPKVVVKLNPETFSITVNSIQLDSTGLSVPLVLLDGLKLITSGHLEYSIKWSTVGEKMAKIMSFTGPWTGIFFMSKVALEFCFNKPEHAEMCQRVLNVDPELKPHLISRNITVIDTYKMIITFESKDLRLLRVAVQGILDAVYLLIETVQAFDPENHVF